MKLFKFFISKIQKINIYLNKIIQKIFTPIIHFNVVSEKSVSLKLIFHLFFFFLRSLKISLEIDFITCFFCFNFLKLF